MKPEILICILCGALFILVVINFKLIEGARGKKSKKKKEKKKKKKEEDDDSGGSGSSERRDRQEEGSTVGGGSRGNTVAGAAAGEASKRAPYIPTTIRHEKEKLCLDEKGGKVFLNFCGSSTSQLWINTIDIDGTNRLCNKKANCLQSSSIGLITPQTYTYIPSSVELSKNQKWSITPGSTLMKHNNGKCIRIDNPLGIKATDPKILNLVLDTNCNETWEYKMDKIE